MVDKEVCVIHRGVLQGVNNVRPAQIDDLDAVGKIDKKLQKLMRQAIVDGHEEGKNVPLRPFVLCLGKQPIGGIVIEEEVSKIANTRGGVRNSENKWFLTDLNCCFQEEIDRIRSLFDIEQFVEFEQIEKREHFKVSRCSIAPGFHSFTRHLLTESMRQSGCVTLYQRVTSQAPQSPVTREMIPVLPREKIHFDFEKLGTNVPPECSLGECDYGLMLLSKKHFTISNRSISHAIVIVGASDVGVAAAQQLAMMPHLIFNNLTMVSPIFHDDKFVVVGKKREPVEARLMNDFGAAKIGLSVSVNRVRGTMAGIQPNRQRLTLKDGTQLPYDLLLLCTGKQPKGLNKILNQ